MTSKTTHYALEKLNNGEPFSTDGQQYTLADRDTIDRLLFQGAEGHHHTGAAAVNANPNTGPTLAVDNTQGNLPGGGQVGYKFTLVDPNGFETAPSPLTLTALPGQATAPNAPALVPITGTGTLVPGNYAYCVSAYTGTLSTSETPASLSASVLLNATGEITLELPTQPAGTTGWNIYRRKPGGQLYYFVTSLASPTGSTPTKVTSWTDDGSLPDICSRTASQQNTTSSTNSVTVTIAQPPSGWTWRLYRSLTGDFTNSFIASVTTVTGATPMVANTYVDNGSAIGSGAPPARSQLVGSPPKVNLGSEVQGVLPTSQVAAFPHVVTFSFPGTLTPQLGQSVWTCDFTSATIVGVRASLGRGSTPASQPVIVDVKKASHSATPTPYTSIFSGAYPEVLVGDQIGAQQSPAVTTLAAGDSLVCDITQSGGGASPTDQYMTVTVQLLVKP